MKYGPIYLHSALYMPYYLYVCFCESTANLILVYMYAILRSIGSNRHTIIILIALGICSSFVFPFGLGIMEMVNYLQLFIFFKLGLKEKYSN